MHARRVLGQRADLDPLAEGVRSHTLQRRDPRAEVARIDVEAFHAAMLATSKLPRRRRDDGIAPRAGATDHRPLGALGCTGGGRLAARRDRPQRRSSCDRDRELSPSSAGAPAQTGGVTWRARGGRAGGGRARGCRRRARSVAGVAGAGGRAGGNKPSRCSAGRAQPSRRGIGGASAADARRWSRATAGGFNTRSTGRAAGISTMSSGRPPGRLL